DRVEDGEDGTEVDPWGVERQVVPRRETAPSSGSHRPRSRHSGALGGAVAECGKCDASGRSSPEPSGDDVIDELCITRSESRPAVASDNERGEGSGRELLLQLRQVSALRDKD